MGRIVNGFSFAGSRGTNPLAAYAVNGLTPETVADFAAVSSNDPLFAYTGLVKTFSEMFTYTGASNKTMVDSTGLVKWAPHNMVLQSESLATSPPWSEAAIETVTGNTADGFVLQPTTASGQHSHNHVKFSVTAGATYTFEIEAKANGYDFIGFNTLGTGAASSDLASTNLSDGTTASQAGVTLAATSLGDGWHRSKYTFVPTETTADFLLYFYVLETSQIFTAYVGDGSSSILVRRPRMYRSDLAGMASVPLDERGLASDATYVPTTTAARYLPRRDSYRYNGTSFVRKGLRLESEARTNSILHSRAFDNAAWGGAATTAANEVGIDGVANSAYTLTDDATSLQDRNQTSTVSDDSNPSAASVFVKKTVAASSFPGITAFFTGGATVVNAGVTVNTDTGAVTARAGSGITAPTALYSENWSADYWRITIVSTNNSTGNTSFRVLLCPAVNASAGSSWANATTGSAVFDQCDVNIGASVPSSPIITGAAAVTRAAETLTIAAAKMSYNATAMWFQMQGEVDFVDTGVANVLRFLRWQAGVSDSILHRWNGITNATDFQQSATVGGSGSVGVSGISPGLNVSFSIAARHLSDEVNGAVNGTAGTANTTPTALPDLSSANFDLGFVLMGHVALFRQGTGDPADVGIEEATS